MPVTPAQSHFRVRTDATAAQGGTPVWAAAQDVNVTLAVDTDFRIRFSVSNTGTQSTTTTWPLFVSRNSGAFVAVTTSSVLCTAVDATAGASANNSLITSSLITGVGTFLGQGVYASDGGATGSYKTQASDYTESEFGLILVSQDGVVGGDTFDFQIRETTNTALSGGYTNTPRITAAASTIVARRLNVLLRR